MFFAQALAGFVLSLAVIGFLVSPIALVIAIRAGWLDIGLTTATTEPTRVDRERIGGLEPGERIVAVTSAKRSRWKLLLLSGIASLPIGWGIAMIVYALRVRKRPQYMFTTERLLIETRGDIESVPLEEVGQVQGGVSPLESIINRGHVTFRIGETTLETVPHLSNVDELVDAITAAQETSAERAADPQPAEAV